MKLCNSEIMKEIKLLEQQKSEVLAEEQRTCQTTYQTEKDKISVEYSFSHTRDKIAEIDQKIRKLKYILNFSNATTIVDAFDMTIGECLVYMAQLNKELQILEFLSRREQTSRRSTINGVVEYTELNYKKEECQERLKQLQDTIVKLQIAIDRTNLTNMIEVD